MSKASICIPIFQKKYEIDPCTRSNTKEMANRTNETFYMGGRAIEQRGSMISLNK